MLNVAEKNGFHTTSYILIEETTPSQIVSAYSDIKGG